jgi:hypothetical protein
VITLIASSRHFWTYDTEILARERQSRYSFHGSSQT